MNKIKKQIKKSVPWFVIFNLVLSTMVAGFVFNFDLKIYNSLNKNIEVTMKAREAQADTATTTVTVRNAPPNFTVQPAENPISTSTSPINVGGAIGFTATADDPENSNYYLIICSTAEVTAHNNGAPTCDVEQFCRSDSTPDTTQASCTYSNVTDPGAQTKDWYAFVCDGVANNADCSAVSQGSQPGILASSSPMYINHAPGFTAINTTVDNQNPGGTFTVAADSIDPDTARGADLLHLYVCQTSSWATSTGCAVEFCHGTSTSPDVSCSFATTTPAVDGTYTYYGFVMDEFYMPSAANSRNNTYTVNNVAPEVSSVVLQSGNSIQLNIKNAAEILATTTSVDITDDNGCQDILYATSSIYWSSATDLDSCSADDNNCYQIASTSCEMIAGSCTDPTDLNVTYTCSTTIAFHAIPSDNATGSPNQATNWLAGIRAFDEALSGVGTTSVGVELLTTSAIEVVESGIAYGTVQAGQDTGTDSATTTVVNFGNSPLNTYLYGVDMESGVNSIGINYQEHSLAAYFQWGTGTEATSTLPGNLENTDVARPTSQTDVSDYIYWGIGVPLGTLSGDYTGTNTFVAALDESGVGW